MRAARLDIPSLVEAARETAATGATEFCIVAAVRGPDERLMAQVRGGRRARSATAVEINVACSLGILTRDAGERAARRWACTATTTTSRPRARYFPQVVTTHTWEERWRDAASSSASTAWRSAAACIIGMGETLEQRAELAAQLARARSRRGAAELPRPAARARRSPTCRWSAAADALRTIAAFRLALPRTVLRFAGGRELTLGDLGARQGMLGGINAIIVGNYLTTLGRDPQDDLDLLAELSMPVKALQRDAVTARSATGAAGRVGAGDHARCRPRARAATDPPRFCTRLRPQARRPGAADRLHGALRAVRARR